MAKKSEKINLAKEASDSNGAGEVEGIVTEAMLKELCPKELWKKFQKAKTPAARADFLYELEKGEYKKARDKFAAIDKFFGALEEWFIQTLPQKEATGVTGKIGRVEVKRKEIATLKDQAKFYAHIKKTNGFDLLNRAINQKAIRERWESGKQVPGVDKFVKRIISLTGVKGGKK